MEPSNNNQNSVGGATGADNTFDINENLKATSSVPTPTYAPRPSVATPAPTYTPRPSTPVTSVPSYTAQSTVESAFHGMPKPPVVGGAPSMVPPHAPIAPASSSVVPPKPMQAPVTAASTPMSTFKPVSTYVPPAPASAPIGGVQAVPHAPSSPFNTSMPSAPKAAPSYATVQAPQVSNSTYSIPTAPRPMAPQASQVPHMSPSVTASGLGGEVGRILNEKPQQAPSKSKGTLMMIVLIVAILAVLGGGAYYWYTNFYTQGPSQDSTATSSQPNNSRPNTSQNTQSAFPAGIKNTPTPAPVVQQTNTKPGAMSKPTNTAAKPVVKGIVPFTSDQRDQVTSYIEANINKLTSVRSSVPFEVTDVTFDGPNRALVQYTNGKSSYTSLAVASIDNSGNVHIASFQLLEK